MSETVRLDEEEEEVYGTLLGGGGDEVSTIPVVYPRGTVIIPSLGYFSSVGSSYIPSHPYFLLSLKTRHIQ